MVNAEWRIDNGDHDDEGGGDGDDGDGGDDDDDDDDKEEEEDDDDHLEAWKLPMMILELMVDIPNMTS